jgi:hypothetical protein
VVVETGAKALGAASRCFAQQSSDHQYLRSYSALMILRRLVGAATITALLTLDAATAASAADPANPSGTFTLSQTSAYIYFNLLDSDPPMAAIGVRRRDLSDDETPAADIVTELDPGDGSAPRPWSCSSDACMFFYSSAGTFTPRVRLIDEDGHTTVITLPQVRILQDLTPPTASVTAPKPRLRKKLSSWRVIRGTAADPGIGVVNFVRVVVLQKRHGWWYIHNPFEQKKWRKGLRSEAATYQRFHPGGGEAILTGRHTWRSQRIPGLTRGPIVVRLWAGDVNMNTSNAPVAARGRITRR